MLALRSSVRRLPTLSVSMRMAYSEGGPHGSFGKKEKAHEDQYAREHEAAQLKKLREQIEAKKKELESLQQQHDEIKKD